MTSESGGPEATGSVARKFLPDNWECRRGYLAPVPRDSFGGRPSSTQWNKRRRTCIDSRPLILLWFLAAGVPFLAAQDTSSEFWPSLNGSCRLNRDWQIGGTVTEHVATNPKDNDFRIGASLYYHLPLTFTGPLARHHPEESRFLSVNGGYLYIPPAPNGTAAVENRGIFQFVGRIPLLKRLLMMDRNEMDLRWVSESFYWRYRNRVTLQRNFTIRSYTISPMVFGEVQYYSKYDSWYRTDYGFGVRFPVAKLVEILPYYERENTTYGKPAHVNAAGVSVTFFFRD